MPEPSREPIFWPWALLMVAINTTLVATLSGPTDQQYWVVGVALLGFLICFGELVVALLLMIPQQTRPWGGVLLKSLGLFAGMGIIALGGLCFLG